MSERWARIEALVHEALARPAAERGAFLDAECRTDPALRQEVDSLLVQATGAGSFLETPPAVPSLTGRQLGPYRVDAQIGAGGMGEVYRAHDTKLGRDVAIKILPALWTQDPDRLARLGREARMLATLNHPHIGAIYGLEEADGVRGLVLELVDGETLAERIARGSVPIADALRIAAQIADALQAAHDKRIVHRDLKPANIKITTGGTVKVLDFGLAKASAGEHAETTLATRDGAVLGTPAYMSPEQARGETLDQRTDVWAFGCVLYEMLTARRAFGGATASDAMAAVLQGEPDWSALPAATPGRVRRLLIRCLAKDLTRRLHAAADARLEIDDALATPAADATVGPGADRRVGWRGALPWSVAAASLAVAGAVLMLWAPWRQVFAPEPLQLSTELDPDVPLPIGRSYGANAILSPNGAVVAFVGRKGAGGSTQLYIRRLRQLQAAPLPGTDDAGSPFFSPDGQWIAFFAGGKLKKISVTEGGASTLCAAPAGRGGAWGEDDTIAFAPDTQSRLLRVSAEGGAPEPLTSLAEGEASHRWPQVLPGGRAVLYTASRSPASYKDANLVVQPLPTGAPKVVWSGGYYGRYLPSGLGSPKRAEREGGHLVYIHDGTLFAVPFDLDRLTVTGQPVPALEGVTSNATSGGAQFAVSASGTLMYLAERSTRLAAPIYSMDHQGKTTPLWATPVNWFNLRVAPDGSGLAMQIDGQTSDIWVWARDHLSQLTFDKPNATRPVWTPDSRRLVFSSTRENQATPNLWWQRADGTGKAERLTTSNNTQHPASWDRSGKFLAFEELNPQTGWGVMILTMEGDEASGWKPGRSTVFLNGPTAELDPMFSPDGRWIAYVETMPEPGLPEVFVRPFPGPGEKRQISAGGGSSPTWSHTSHEIFYGVKGQIMVAAYTVEGDSFRAKTPRPWSEGRYMVRSGRPFDLYRDGERFALAPAERTPPEKKQDYLLFFNFFDELRRIAPVTKR
jgi:Tol biopolymer transport system component